MHPTDLVMVDAESCAVQRLSLGGALGVSADGSRLYTGSLARQGLRRRPATLQQGGLPMPSPARRLALTLDGSRSYALGADGAERVYVGDTTIRAVTATFATRPGAVQLLMYTDGPRLDVGNSTGTLETPSCNTPTAYDTRACVEISHSGVDAVAPTVRTFRHPGRAMTTSRPVFRPEYRNITVGSGAIGSFQFDTTTLTNGIHTRNGGCRIPRATLRGLAAGMSKCGMAAEAQPQSSLATLSADYVRQHWTASSALST